MPVMKGQIDTVEDDFWTERLPFFTAQFLIYYRKPQQVHGRFHTSEERYEASLPNEIIPLSEKKGIRTYVMMHPYVVEPKLTLTIGLYSNPKHYADQESPIGETIGTPQVGPPAAITGFFTVRRVPRIMLWTVFAIFFSKNN